MKPVKQDRLWSPDGIGNGNCLAACHASLLEIPLWMVPPWDLMFGRGGYQARVSEWLERFFSLKMTRVEGHPVDALPEFYIASGLSPRDVMHATIYSKGQLVHDPHWSNAGIDEVEYCQFLEPLQK